MQLHQRLSGNVFEKQGAAPVQLDFNVAQRFGQKPGFDPQDFVQQIRVAVGFFLRLLQFLHQ